MMIASSDVFLANIANGPEAEVRGESESKSSLHRRLLSRLKKAALVVQTNLETLKNHLQDKVQAVFEYLNAKNVYLCMKEFCSPIIWIYISITAIAGTIVSKG